MASKYFQFWWLSAANNWTQNTLWSSQAVSFKWTGIYCKIMVHGTFFCYLALFCSWFMSMNKWHSAMLPSAFCFFIHMLKTHSAVVLMWVLQVPTCSVHLFFFFFFFFMYWICCSLCFVFIFYYFVVFEVVNKFLFGTILDV